MTTQIEEIARVQTTESDRTVNYILTLEYDAAETDPDDGYVKDADWTLRLYRRHEVDGDRFGDNHDTVVVWLCDIEDRPPTVHDVTEEVWSDLFKDAQDALGWTSWHNVITATRLFVRLTQEAGVP